MNREQFINDGSIWNRLDKIDAIFKVVEILKANPLGVTRKQINKQFGKQFGAKHAISELIKRGYANHSDTVTPVYSIDGVQSLLVEIKYRAEREQLENTVARA